MKQQIKAFMPILAVLLLNIINPQKARAEEYLWNPTLAWEDSTAYSSVAGMKLIKNDEQIIYFADGVIYLRDTKTGKLLATSEKFPEGKVDCFSMSDDFKNIYAIHSIGKIGLIYQIDASTLNIKHKTTIPIKEFPYKWIEYKDGRTFMFDYLLNAYSVNESDFRLIYRAIPPAKAPWENFEMIFGTCVVKINPLIDSVDFNRDDMYEIVLYEKNRYDISNYNNGMLIICDSNKIIHILDRVTIKEQLTINSQQYDYSFSPGSKYLLLYSSDSLLFIDTGTKDIVKKYDVKKLSLREMSYHFLNFDNNINHIFDNKSFPYDYTNFKGSYYYDDVDKKIKLVYDPNFRINTMHIIPALNLAFLINIDNYNHIQGYNLNPKSSVENHNELIPTLKSDKNTLYISYENNLPKRIIFYDNSGKEIYSTTKDFKVTENEIICDISNLQNGVYLIKVEFEHNTVFTFKFVRR